MTKTEARLLLAQRQRRFEWELARDEQTRAAARLVAGRTHALLNMVQIVQLSAPHLEASCDEPSQIFLADLARAAKTAQAELSELLEVARPDDAIVRGAPVGAVVASTIDTLRPAIEVDIHLATAPDTCTRCTSEELEHLLIGLALEALDREHSLEHLEHPEPRREPRIELAVRERAIAGAPWIEIVQASAGTRETDHFELRVVSAIARKRGGELATSERRGGGVELVVALPVVADAA